MPLPFVIVVALASCVVGSAVGTFLTYRKFRNPLGDVEPVTMSNLVDVMRDAFSPKACEIFERAVEQNNSDLETFDRAWKELSDINLEEILERGDPAELRALHAQLYETIPTGLFARLPPEVRQLLTEPGEVFDDLMMEEYQKLVALNDPVALNTYGLTLRKMFPTETIAEFPEEIQNLVINAKANDDEVDVLPKAA